MWEWYLRLSGTGAELTFTEIHSWMFVTGEMPTPDEVDILMDLSAASREWWVEKRKRDNPSGS